MIKHTEKEKRSILIAREINNLEINIKKKKVEMIQAKSDYFSMCQKAEKMRKDFINFWVDN